MNGDLKVIFDKIVEVQNKQTEITTKVDERHTENKQDLKVIFKKLGKLDTLPCEVHIERMSWFNRYLIGISGIITLIIAWLVKTHLRG